MIDQSAKAISNDNDDDDEFDEEEAQDENSDESNFYEDLFPRAAREEGRDAARGRPAVRRDVHSLSIIHSPLQSCQRE